MRTLRDILALATMAFFFAAGCGDDPQPVKPRPKAQKTAPAPSPSPPPGETDSAEAPGAGTGSIWPFSQKEEAPLALASNLLAKNYFLVFDGSGSMAEYKCSGNRPKIAVAKDAVVNWSASVPQDANLGLFVFHNDDRSTLPLPADREQFDATVQAVRAGGGTPLTEAVLHAYRELTRQAKRQLGYGEYTIVVVTDGIANNENTLRRAVDAILGQTPIVVYSIGFCIGTRHALNQPGKTVYKAADNPEQLAEGLREVLAESEFFDAPDFE